MQRIDIDKQLSLELLRNDHAAQLAALIDSNRDFLRQWLPWLDLNRSVADSSQFIQETMRQHRLGTGVQYAIVERTAAQRVIGVIGYTRIDKHNRTGKLGYWIDQVRSGEGIASRSVEHMLPLGFGELELHKIEIHCSVHNRRARALAERLGFVHEAILRDCELLNGKYVDHAIYSLLASEYRANVPAGT
ncbi:MAG: GNAT family protein [Pseudomonadales bacterium]